MMSFQESFFFNSGNSARISAKASGEQEFLSQLRNEAIRIGTSSWKFRGWEGIVYHEDYRSQIEFERNCLREYGVRFSTVSVDATYYDWPREAYMRRLLDQLPESFLLCLKVTNQITMPDFPRHPRWGNMAGLPNPNFLSAEKFLQDFWQPLAFMKEKISSVILEFSAGGLQLDQRFTNFMQLIPREIPLTIEFRDPELWNDSLFAPVRESGHMVALHSYTALPELQWQWKRIQAAGILESSAHPILVRSLLPAYREKSRSMDQMDPYNEVIDPQPEILKDIKSIINDARQKKRAANVILGNCLEGSAPKSIDSLLHILRETPNTLVH